MCKYSPHGGRGRWGDRPLPDRRRPPLRHQPKKVKRGRKRLRKARERGIAIAMAIGFTSLRAIIKSIWTGTGFCKKLNVFCHGPDSSGYADNDFADHVKQSSLVAAVSLLSLSPRSLPLKQEHQSAGEQAGVRWFPPPPPPPPPPHQDQKSVNSPSVRLGRPERRRCFQSSWPSIREFVPAVASPSQNNGREREPQF